MPPGGDSTRQHRSTTTITETSVEDFMYERIRFIVSSIEWADDIIIVALKSRVLCLIRERPRILSNDSCRLIPVSSVPLSSK